MSQQLPQWALAVEPASLQMVTARPQALSGSRLTVWLPENVVKLTGELV